MPAELDPTKPTPAGPEHAHGTLDRYQAGCGCGCANCTAAVVRHENRERHRRAQSIRDREMRPPADIRRWLRDTEHHLARIIANAPGAYAVLRWSTPDGYPSGGSGRGAGHGNPTEAAAIRRIALARDEEAPDEEPTDLVLARRFHWLMEWSRDLADDLARIGKIHPRLAELAWKEQRCSGGEGAWADQSCDRMRTTTSGLCDACDRRRRRHDERQREEAS